MVRYKFHLRGRPIEVPVDEMNTQEMSSVFHAGEAIHRIVDRAAAVPVTGFLISLGGCFFVGMILSAFGFDQKFGDALFLGAVFAAGSLLGIGGAAFSFILSRESQHHDVAMLCELCAQWPRVQEFVAACCNRDRRVRSALNKAAPIAVAT